MNLLWKYFTIVAIFFALNSGATNRSQTTDEMSAECELVLSSSIPLKRNLIFAPYAVEFIQMVWTASQYDIRAETLDRLVKKYDTRMSVSHLVRDPILRLQVVTGTRKIEKIDLIAFNEINSRSIGGPQALSQAEAQDWLFKAEKRAQLEGGNVVTWKHINDSFIDLFYFRIPRQGENRSSLNAYWISLLTRVYRTYLIPNLQKDLNSILPAKFELQVSEEALRTAIYLGYDKTNLISAIHIVRQYHIQNETLRRFNSAHQ